MTSADQPARILFLLQRPEAWINLESLWHALANQRHVDCHAWVLPYNARDVETTNAKTPQLVALLRERGIPFDTWPTGTPLEPGLFDVAVLNHPYDRERPRALWLDALRKAIRHVVYVPYGLPAGGGRKNLLLQYAQPTQRNADLVIARSALEKQQYARHCPRGDAHVIVTGLPRFDTLASALQRPIPGAMARFIGNRTTLMWNAHFSFGRLHSQTSNFSTFDLLGPTIFSLARQYRDQLCLIWRPHPGVVPALLKEGMLDHSSVSRLRAELADIGIWWDDSPDHAAAFAASDALATDPGSFVIEYLLMRRPMLVLENPEGEALNDEARMLQAATCTASTPAQVEGFVLALLEGRCTAPSEETIAKHLPMLDGQAGGRVAAEILRLLGRPAPHVPQAAPRRSSPQSGRQPAAVCDASPMIPESALDTPVLDRLCRSLEGFSASKHRETYTRKALRRAVRSVRSTFAETAKQMPLMLAIRTFLTRK